MFGVVNASSRGQPKVKDALSYLEEVKEVFKDRISVYDEFLTIMQLFKNRQLDTKGVIAKVKFLFHGRRHLLQGFNQFLPDGYSIDPDRLDSPVQPPTVPPVMDPPVLAPGLLPPPTIQPAPVQAQAPIQPMHTINQAIAVHPLQPISAIPTTPQPSTKEFNHAVDYVAKIKSRFSDNSKIYEQFLEILHEYQEKPGNTQAINNVKQHVFNLFRGHDDLLKGFRYFLPDDMKEGFPDEQYQALAKRKLPPAVRRVPRKVERKRRKIQPSSDEEQSDETESDDARVPRYRGRPASTMSRHKLRTGLQPPVVPFPENCDTERQLFQRMQDTMPSETFHRVLKVLNLFSQEIISRSEMAGMINDLCQLRFQQVAAKFHMLIGYDEDQELIHEARNRTNYYSFVKSEYFMECPKVTPSYHELPKDLPLPSCSLRSPLCEEIANDRFVSASVGSEDQYTVRYKSRQEARLEQLDDDRYELDMMIATNQSVIRVLQPMNDLITRSINQGERCIVSGRNVISKLSVLHQRAVQRLYGHRAGDIFELLSTRPETAVPVLLERLMEKEVEWRLTRDNMKAPWREISEKNANMSFRPPSSLGGAQSEEDSDDGQTEPILFDESKLELSSTSRNEDNGSASEDLPVSEPELRSSGETPSPVPSVVHDVPPPKINSEPPQDQSVASPVARLPSSSPEAAVPPEL